METKEWKEKFSGLLNICQDEIKKTTEIGKKMLNASRINGELHDTYEALGKLTRQEFLDKKLESDDPKFKELIEKIGSLEEELKDVEDQVSTLKKEESDTV